MDNMSGPCKWMKDEYIKQYISKVEKVTGHILTKFEKLSAQATEDLCELTRDNVVPESSANIGKYQRWLDRLFEERKTLNDFKFKKTKMFGELYHHYKFNSDIKDRLRSDNAINKYVEKHDCFIAISEIVKMQESLVLYIEGTVQNLHSRNFAIKNIIAAWSAELGIYNT